MPPRHIFYSTYETENEAIAVDRKKAAVIGSGPIRIGQGIEFDYCSGARGAGAERGRLPEHHDQFHPETVSTDFDTSDRLYFESLDEESIRDILDNENSNNATAAMETHRQSCSRRSDRD